MEDNILPAKLMSSIHQIISFTLPPGVYLVLVVIVSFCFVSHLGGLDFGWKSNVHHHLKQELSSFDPFQHSFYNSGILKDQLS